MTNRIPKAIMNVTKQYVAVVCDGSPQSKGVAEKVRAEKVRAEKVTQGQRRGQRMRGHFNHLLTP
jgi:hypothetical protein